MLVAGFWECCVIAKKKFDGARNITSQMIQQSEDKLMWNENQTMKWFLKMSIVNIHLRLQTDVLAPQSLIQAR